MVHPSCMPHILHETLKCYGCNQTFGHCPPSMAKNPTSWICHHLSMKWGGGEPTPFNL
jgi:hypothetical protein